MPRELPPCRIAYAGCLSSGRRTSLAEVAGAPPVVAEGTFTFESDSPRCEVTARIVGPRQQPRRGELPLEPEALRQIEQDRAFVASADAIIFVVDPTRGRTEASSAELQWCRQALSAAGREPAGVPLVFQLNKLDLPIDGAGAERYAPVIGWRDQTQLLVRVPLSVLRRTFRWPGCAYVETIADAGIGVREAMQAALALIERASG